MVAVASICAVLALAGWIAAWRLFVARKQHVCPVQPPDRSVLLNYAGLPESVRSLKGAPPKTYARPHGDKPAIVYARIGTAAVYQATSAKR